jgi:hypothetical protein
MSYFSDFLDEELAMVLSIPVRVGFWISHIDDIQGTSRDDEKERVALEKVLRTVFKKTDGKAFSNDVVEEGLRRKDLWPQWENNAGTVLADIPKVMYMLKERLPADAVLGFQKAVFYVGRVVAQAASEGGGEDDIRKEVMGGGLIASIMDRFSVKTDLQMPKNISNSEKAALQKLLQSLKG